MDTPVRGAARRHRRVAPSRAGLVVGVTVVTMAVGGCAELQRPEVEQVAAAFTRSGAVNRVGLAFGGLFLATLIGQAFAGLAQFNEQQVAQGSEPVSLLNYVTSSSFAVDVVENWQSEYLQFFLDVFGTVGLVQRGYSESKPVGAAHDDTGETG